MISHRRLAVVASGFVLASLLVSACMPLEPLPTTTPPEAPAKATVAPAATSEPASLAEEQAPAAPPSGITGPETDALPASDLDEAITTLRRVGPHQLEDGDYAVLNAAADKIVSAGPDGVRRLKQELATLDVDAKDTVLFRHVAAHILWRISRLDEAETIAEIWGSIPAESWSYRQIFYPAMHAASLQDDRALPMLLLLLSDQGGSIYLENHMMTLGYPLTHQFLWGAFGSRGLPVLHQVLQTSEDPEAVESAIALLGRAQYLPALSDIRQALNSETDGIRRAAILALGLFGHPQDLDSLLAGLDSEHPDEVFQYVYALLEYGDVAATPSLLPLLQSEDEAVRAMIAWSIGNDLATAQGIAALKDCSLTSEDEMMSRDCAAYLGRFLNSVGVTWEEFSALPTDTQEQLVTDFRIADLVLQEGEEAVTYGQFLAMFAEMTESGYLGSDTWDWVETRHVLPVATADDIDLLLDAKARFYLRLSDEAIYDARVIDDLVKWVGRSRYREVAGQPAGS